MRPRLLVLASTFPGRPGDGTPEFVSDLARREAEHFDTLVLVPSVSGSAPRERDGRMAVRRFRYFPRRWETLADGAIIENLRQRPARWLQVVPFIVAEALTTLWAVRRLRPDVVHAHWIVPQGLVATVCAPRTPRLITTLGGDLYALDGPLMRRVKRWVVRRAGHVTVMNEEMRRRVLDLGARPDQVSVMPMGADLSGVVPRVDRPGGHVRLLFVGRLVEKKGLEVLLTALRSVDADISLTVIGDGPLRADLERQARGLPVTFVGQRGRTALRHAYAEADVVVVPSVPAASGDQDGLPVVLLEAMGTGCAVVASDLAGIDEAVRDGVDGVLTPPGDAVRLAQAIDSLAGDPERRAELGRAARDRAASFSADAVGARYVDLLRTLTEGARTRHRRGGTA
ncbi:glycosyltransferase family 4 protein [Georgenia satyanarayanai]|uniref:glycosyltransferase family 4 protein n=1 Tax=Georgenia satyanarayanai TaxID=860221 RepID=UPI00203F47B7|nr:glycosyltransferase family 4 protein [Georgenia satyanarayanai]MCM3661045.1 glycosyltransferase family 4 protein [Georgenia satyanarayanai]